MRLELTFLGFADLAVTIPAHYPIILGSSLWIRTTIACSRGMRPTVRRNWNISLELVFLLGLAPRLSALCVVLS